MKHRPRFLPIFIAFLLTATFSLAAENSATIRVALFQDSGVSGPGVPRVTEQLAAAGGFEVVQINGQQIAEGALKGFDVVVFTGGTGGGQARSLGETGRKNVQQFVRDGGGYVGICAGAYLACADFGWGLGLLNAKAVSPKWQRGTGPVQMEITSAGSEILDLNSEVKTVYYENGPIFQPAGVEGLSEYKTLALFRTELSENGTPPGIMVDSPAIASGTYGNGRVIISSPHPEQSAGLETFAPAAIRWTAAGNRH